MEDGWVQTDTTTANKKNSDDFVDIDDMSNNGGDQ